MDGMAGRSGRAGGPRTRRGPWSPLRGSALVAALLVAGFGMAEGLHAQASPGIPLSEILERLEAVNPELRRADAVAGAAGERVDPAGALPDPMFTAGLMNLPAWSLDLGMEGMSMAVLEVGQRFPARGVREARVQAAEARVQAAMHRRDALALELRVQAAEGYAELLYLDETLAVLERTRALLVELAEVARVRLGEGSGAQVDVVRTHTELARIEEQVSELRAARTRAEMALSALLDGSLPPRIQAERPEAWARLLALPASAEDFTTTVPDQLPGLGLPPLAELLDQAMAGHPGIAAAQAALAVEEAEARLSERERRPDVEVMLGYGLRSGRDNMWSASVTLPLPVFRARKQDPLARAASGEAEAARAAVRSELAELEARIRSAWSDLARARERFHLVERLVLPQAHATVESAMSAFRAGSDVVSFLSVLESLMTLLASETERARSARDLALASARLDGAAGTALFTDSGS
jgi:outer membrane protein, heavy metal efflux system